MEDIVVLSAVRTPVGAFQGMLSELSAHALGGRAIAAAVERAGLTPQDVEQVNMGCVLPAGQGQAPARQAALAAGCPVSTGALTLNKVCGSGMRAVMIAANDLRCGDFKLVVAGGMESMSQAPYLATGVRDGLRLGHGKLIDSMIHDGLWDPYNDLHMGSCAELCAGEFQFSREEQDAFSVESYRRAREATETGLFAEEIVPVPVPQKKGEPRIVDRDEEPFKADLSRIGTLKPAFQKDGTITAGNASKINDGASALVLTTAGHARSLGLRPIGRVVAQASFAQKPEWFTTAPVAAARRCLERAGSPPPTSTCGVRSLAVVTTAFQSASTPPRSTRRRRRRRPGAHRLLGRPSSSPSSTPCASGVATAARRSASAAARRPPSSWNGSTSPAPMAHRTSRLTPCPRPLCPRRCPQQTRRRPPLRPPPPSRRPAARESPPAPTGDAPGRPPAPRAPAAPAPGAPSRRDRHDGAGPAPGRDRPAGRGPRTGINPSSSSPGAGGSAPAAPATCSTRRGQRHPDRQCKSFTGHQPQGRRGRDGPEHQGRGGDRSVILDGGRRMWPPCSTSTPRPARCAGRRDGGARLLHRHRDRQDGR